jgi:hypothetical protein
VLRERSCAEVIILPRSPTDCEYIRTLKKRPGRDVGPLKKLQYLILQLIRKLSYNKYNEVLSKKVNNCKTYSAEIFHMT